MNYANVVHAHDFSISLSTADDPLLLRQVPPRHMLISPIFADTHHAYIMDYALNCWKDTVVYQDEEISKGIQIQTSSYIVIFGGLKQQNWEIFNFFT